MFARFVRMISSTSRKPAVVIRPTSGVFRSSSAFSAMVVPWDEGVERRRRRPDLREPVEDADRDVLGCRRHLERRHGSLDVAEHDIGERSADVDREALAALAHGVLRPARLTGRPSA